MDVRCFLLDTALALSEDRSRGISLKAGSAARTGDTSSRAASWTIVSMTVATVMGVKGARSQLTTAPSCGA